MRTTQWSLLVAVQETDWSLPNSVLFLIEYTASLLFCTCYTILLYIWGEQWAFRKRFPSDPFRYLFFSLTAVVYTLALACFVCECIVDTEEATGTTQDYRNTYRLSLPFHNQNNALPTTQTHERCDRNDSAVDGVGAVPLRGPGLCAVCRADGA